MNITVTNHYGTMDANEMSTLRWLDHGNPSFVAKFVPLYGPCRGVRLVGLMFYYKIAPFPFGYRHPHVTHCSSGQAHSSVQTASRPVQPFLYGSQILCCTMHCKWRSKNPQNCPFPRFPLYFVNLPEEDCATAIGNMHNKLVKIAEISSRTERQTDTQMYSLQYFVSKNHKRW